MRFVTLSDLGDDERRALGADMRGWELRSARGGSLGRVRDVVLREGAPSHLDVQAGPLFAPRRVLIPVATVRVDADRESIVVPQTMEALIERLPEFDGDLDALEREVERPAGSGGVDEAGPLRIERAEEELQVGTRTTAAGELVVHKTVEVEHATAPATRSREEVQTERRAATDERAQRGLPYEVGDELHVPIVEEELVVQTRRVVREVLVIRKHVVRETVEVEADLRKERVRVERVRPADAPDDRAG